MHTCMNSEFHPLQKSLKISSTNNLARHFLVVSYTQKYVRRVKFKSDYEQSFNIWYRI